MNSLNLVFGANTNITDNTTRFFPLSGYLDAQSTEANVEMAVRDAGTFSNAFAYIPLNTASNTSTITLRKSRADTSLVISIAGDSTGVKEDTSNTATFAATDEVDWEVTVPTEGGTNNLTLSLLGVQFAPTTAGDCVTIIGQARDSSVLSTNSGVWYWMLSAQCNFIVTSEPQTKFRFTSAFTSSNLLAFVATNTRGDNDTNFRSRKNGVNGNQVLNYLTLETGVKEDPSNSDSIANGDDFNYAVSLGTGSGNLGFRILQSRILSTNGDFVMMCGRNNGIDFGVNLTRYFGVSSDLSAVSTTEVGVQIYPRFTFTAKQLSAYAHANTVATSNVTITFRDNGGNGNQVLTYAPGQSGLKNEPTNTDVITSGTDEIDYVLVTPNTSGTFSLDWIGCVGHVDVSGAAVIQDIIQSGIIAFAR